MKLDPTRPDYAEVMARHEAAVSCGLSTYIDPTTGYTVMTAAYLEARGFCCSSDCRHCPWEGIQE
ncbi:MAG: hypothetical protein KDB02_03185 [Acidimicrobiales bacterium]|nr:hypothetical protein [Acidimicrobiales bacterium]MCB1245654.1 hypothetical protein [Acidimicrobiia bacterium]